MHRIATRLALASSLFVFCLPTARALGMPPRSVSLLDEVGRLSGPVTEAQVADWKHELRKPDPPGDYAARLNLWLGEIELAKNEQPVRAIERFVLAKNRSPPDGSVYGRACYDTAIARFYAGEYSEAAESFRYLLGPKNGLRGYSRRECALWLKHARACAGYHRDHAKLGIPQPSRLDPLCGVSGLTICLHGLGLPYDKNLVSSATRYTGEGSRLGDLVAACGKLGVSAYPVTADEKGLIALPKPLIAHIERDHFVAVVRADKRGVTYVCSDCGPWPGGRVDLTWRQWRALDAGPYLSVVRKGSVEDRVLQALPSGGWGAGRAAALSSGGGAVRLASTGSVPAGARQQLLLMALLKGHVQLFVYFPTAVSCGLKPEALHCWTCCPMDGSGAGGGGGGGMRAFGASAGDPVNLATGEEEYSPGADLVVYNARGPSVVWSRKYNSLRSQGGYYCYDDFGMSWSHPYNVGVYDPNGATHAISISQGSTGHVNRTGTLAPASGTTWTVYKDGTSIATSSSSNGWTVTGINSSGCTVVVPSSAVVSDGYEVHFYLGYPGLTNGSGIFGVISAGYINQGATATVAANGSDLPGTGLTWDVVLGGITVATSAAPNGWAVTGSNGQFQITVPFSAPAANNYEVRYNMTGPYKSATFNVIGNLYQPSVGTRYLVLPNGAQISFSAGSIPTYSSPVVICGVQAGAPMRIEWDYDGSLSGHYTITFADQTKWVTTTLSKVIDGAALYYSLYSLADRVGNAIYFNYGMISSNGFPLLSAIKDSAGNTLLAFARSGSTGNLTSVSDGYGRSVYYHVGSYATTNVSPGYLQSYQELDSVSQIVTTGTSNPPSRYAYGYTNVNNGEGPEQVPFLTSITVPSPTGTGNATATINYRSDAPYVASVVDANGNKREYTDTDASHTKVTVKNSAGTVIYSYTAGFNSQMSRTSITDGTNTATVYSEQYSDANDPYKPSSTTDGNGRTWNYTWDVFGHLLTATTPRFTTTYTWNYSVFPLGRLMSAQEASKTSTTLTYYEPSGLLQSVSTPTPGTSGAGTRVTTSYTYDAHGNPLTVVAPGNNAASAITTTLNYTTDGTYSQNAAARQPITATNNLGKVHPSALRRQRQPDLRGR